MNDRVQVALEDNQSKEEARLLHRDKVFEAHALGERWKCIYKDIDASVDEIMTQLKGGPTSGIGQLEVINIKFDAIRTRLEYVKTQSDAAQSLADAMVSNYPDQTMVTIMEQVAKRTAIESMIETCKDLMSTMRSTGDKETSRQSRVTIPKAQVYLVPDFGSKGRPSGGQLKQRLCQG